MVIAWGSFKKDPELGPSFKNQTKKELEIFVVSYTNISSSVILILNSIQEKTIKDVFSNMQ